jgi:hypothetical protein
MSADVPQYVASHVGGGRDVAEGDVVEDRKDVPEVLREGLREPRPDERGEIGPASLGERGRSV